MLFGVSGLLLLLLFVCLWPASHNASRYVSCLCAHVAHDRWSWSTATGAHSSGPSRMACSSSPGGSGGRPRGPQQPRWGGGQAKGAPEAQVGAEGER